MAGVRGRVGRKPLSVEEHLAKGTWRKDRHGPAVVPAVTPEAVLAPRVRAPTHLRAETRRWFRAVVAGWQLEPHHVRLLTLACQAWDRAVEAREAIATGGLTVKSSRGGPRLNPLLRVENENRTMFARLVQQLDLESVASRATWGRILGGPR